MGFVYFFQQSSESCFKIGSSENGVAERLTGCQVGNPKRLRIFGTIESGQYEQLEDDLHKKFDKYHEGGEWFSIDAATAVKTIQELAGKILVDDPFRFSVNGAQKIIDVDEITKQIKRGFFSDAEVWFDAKFEKHYSQFVEKLDITADMAVAVARRRAARKNALKAFLLVFILISFTSSAIAFWACFDYEAKEDYLGTTSKKGYWDFSGRQVIKYVLLEILIFVASLGIGIGVGSDNNKATDTEINWERFQRLQKKLLRDKK